MKNKKRIKNRSFFFLISFLFLTSLLSLKTLKKVDKHVSNAVAIFCAVNAPAGLDPPKMFPRSCPSAEDPGIAVNDPAPAFIPVEQ